MPEKAAFLPHTGGKLWKLRVKNVQRGEIKNMQFVETKQFEQKDLLFREKNAIMSICICGSIQQYRSERLRSRFPQRGGRPVELLVLHRRTHEFVRSACIAPIPEDDHLLGAFDS